ncbi:MAG: hypothetical protein IPI50_12870 [Saprospiraceae bacterium]|nr:hypothetical protein [Saprospiraceae bacterium]
MDYNWIDDFISNEVLTYDVKNNEDELYVKSCCEYILYCYQIKSHQIKLTEQNYCTLLKLTDCTQLIYCKHILDLCLNGTTNETQEKYPDSVEYFYVLDLIKGRSNEKFWNVIFSNFLRRISDKGITENEAYNLTHYIFYSTNFGINCKILQLNLKLKISLTAILDLCVSKFESEKNWDLCFELYICLLIVDSQYEIVMKKISTYHSIFYSGQGWILSNGDNKKYFEVNYSNLNFKQKYSLFHTTLLYNLLTVKIQNYSQQLSLNAGADTNKEFTYEAGANKSSQLCSVGGSELEYGESFKLAVLKSLSPTKVVESWRIS